MKNILETPARFNAIDINTWDRKTHYEHYLNNVRCTYSFTLNIDISSLAEKLKSRKLKTYPAQIYIISKAVNLFKEFKMALDGEGGFGWWDIVNPSYTVFNKSTETFSCVFTPFDDDFAVFYDACAKDMEAYMDARTLFPQRDMPKNLFAISSLPWIDFTSFNLNADLNTPYFAPIFTIGRHFDQDGKKHMPLSVQVHHSVCDGFHAGKFVQTLREISMGF